MTAIGILTLHFLLPGCTSLKEKRGRIKPVLAHLHREYNLATAEVDLQDRWQEAVLAVVTLSNDSAQVQRVLQSGLDYCSRGFADLELLDHRIEML